MAQISALCLQAEANRGWSRAGRGGSKTKNMMIEKEQVFEFNLWLESDHFNNFSDDQEKKEKFRALAEKLTNRLKSIAEYISQDSIKYAALTPERILDVTKHLIHILTVHHSSKRLRQTSLTRKNADSGNLTHIGIIYDTFMLFFNKIYSNFTKKNHI